MRHHGLPRTQVRPTGKGDPPGRAREVALPLQASRGCWWGQRSQCAFCGLNGLGLGYRARSPERVVQELEHMADSAGLYRFQLLDNILDMRAFATWLLRLAASGRPWNLFAEVKSNLGERHVRLLAAAGLRWLQPGIESLDSRLLALMGKGARAWQQVQLLKLAREHGLYPWCPSFAGQGLRDPGGLCLLMRPGRGPAAVVSVTLAGDLLRSITENWSADQDDPAQGTTGSTRRRRSSTSRRKSSARLHIPRPAPVGRESRRSLGKPWQPV